MIVSHFILQNSYRSFYEKHWYKNSLIFMTDFRTQLKSRESIIFNFILRLHAIISKTDNLYVNFFLAMASKGLLLSREKGRKRKL